MFVAILNNSNYCISITSIKSLWPGKITPTTVLALLALNLCTQCEITPTTVLALLASDLCGQVN